MTDSEADPVDLPDSDPSWTVLAGIISNAEAEEMLAHRAEIRARSRYRLDWIVEQLRDQ